MEVLGVLGHDHDGQLGHRLGGAGDPARVDLVAQAPVVVGRGHQVPLALRRQPGVGVPGVVVRELPIVEPRLEVDGVGGVRRDVQPETDGVRRPGRDRLGVDHGPRRPGVSLVDRVAVLVDQQGAVEVGALVDRRRLVGHAAPEDRLARRVGRLELDPAVGGVDGAAGEGVAHAAGAHHHVDARRVAPAHGGGDPVEGGVDRLGRAARRGAQARAHGDPGLLADGGGGGEGRPLGLEAPALSPGLRLAAPGHGEDVDAHLVRLEELDHLIELGLVVVGEGQGGVGGGEAVRVDHPVDVAGVVRDDPRHVAVGAGLRARRVIEGAGAEAGDAARLPGVVFVEAAEPAVVVDRHVEVHLVTGGAHLGDVGPAEERLDEGPAVGLGVHAHQEVVEPGEHGVLVGRQAVERREGDLVVPVAHRVVDLGDHVARRAGDPGLRLRRVDDLLDRRVHHPGLEDRRVVAPAAPLRRLDADHVLHVLDGFPVPLVVEAPAVVRRAVPLVEDVRVAPGAPAALRVHVDRRRHQAAVAVGDRGREVGAAGPAHRLLVHAHRRGGVDDHALRVGVPALVDDGGRRQDDGERQAHRRQVPGPSPAPREPPGRDPHQAGERQPPVDRHQEVGGPPVADGEQGHRHQPRGDQRGAGGEEQPLAAAPPPPGQEERRGHQAQTEVGQEAEEVERPRVAGSGEVRAVGDQQGAGESEETVGVETHRVSQGKKSSVRAGPAAPGAASVRVRRASLPQPSPPSARRPTGGASPGFRRGSTPAQRLCQLGREPRERA